MNYNNFKGLPDFLEEMKQMLIEVLQIDGTVVLDIMFFNKKLQQACQFESQVQQGEHL